MHIGIRIRNLRLEKEISQKDLANGIISTSHLSNLETGRFSASEETLECIADRLGVDKKYISNTQPECQHLKRQMEIAFNYIVNNQLLFSLNLEPFIHRIKNVNQELTLFFLANCYYYKKGQHDRYKTLVEHTVNLNSAILEKNLSLVPSYSKLIYLYSLGLHFLFSKNYEKSSLYFNESLKVTKCTNKIANIHYNLAIMNLDLANFIDALYYGDIAIENFLKTADYNNILKVHIIYLEIYYSLSKFNQLTNEIDKLIKIQNFIGKDKINHIIYYYKGLLYQQKGEYTKSLQYYEYVSSIKSSFSFKALLMSIHCLLEIKQFCKAKEILKLAERIANNKKEKTLLLSVEAKIDLNNNYTQLYIKKMNKCLKYLLMSNCIREANIIAEELADYYYSNNKFKKSSDYYKIVCKPLGQNLASKQKSHN